MSQLIRTIKESITVCKSCYRFFPQTPVNKDTCSICSNQNRDHSIVMLVSRDVDLENIEKTGTYEGVYFVLGGTVPILDQNPHERIRIRELISRADKEIPQGMFKELILATNANPEGENTADYIRQEIKKKFADTIKISVLGRGLSTGTELEYSDAETIKNALMNRS
jgi:recombination protein RecR